MNQLAGLGSALWLSVGPVAAEPPAPQPASPSLQAVEERMRQMQESFEKQQREMRAQFEHLVREQQAQIDLLQQQLEALRKSAPAVATNAPSPASAEGESLKQRVEELTAASKKTFLSQFNPGIGFVGDSIFSYTSRGADATGSARPGGADAWLRTVELNLEATVDPFARAYGVINGSADARTGETSLGVEEAAIVTTSLPWNLTAQAGRFFADFGRLAYVHDHDLPFVHRPLVLDADIGGESRTDGLQVNYLVPIDHYLSLTVGAGDSFGGDGGPNGVGGFRTLSELNYWGHLSTYFDLSPNLSLETGLSGLINDRSDSRAGLAERRRRIGAADFTLRYQPLDASTRRGWVWGTEILYNSASFDIDPDATPGSGDEYRSNVGAWGLYSYLETKLSRRLKAGFLFDWLQEPALRDAETFRYSPYLTLSPSEFQLLRLQFSHTEPGHLTGLRSSEAVSLQWQFILGRHAHGFKQR
ncbi:MAG TPA: hypothetical protein DCM86_06090 [Verrucomicrobiales bacterium]|nr:hypothetical protein [Verrucomicrobiales bacterium]